MNNVEFGSFLRKTRKSRGMTLEELGNKVDLSKSYLANIENGRRNVPSPEVLQKLSEALCIEHKDLMIRAGYIKEDEVVPSPSDFFKSYIRELVYLLLEDREYEYYDLILDAFEKRIGEIFDKYGLRPLSKRLFVVIDGKIRDDIPEQYVDTITSVDNDQFELEVMKELRDIAHDFHFEFNPNYDDEFMLSRTKRREILLKYNETRELTKFLQLPETTYNGQPLELEDRTRIMEMLKLLFPKSN